MSMILQLGLRGRRQLSLFEFSPDHATSTEATLCHEQKFTEHEDGTNVQIDLDCFSTR